MTTTTRDEVTRSVTKLLQQFDISVDEFIRAGRTGGLIDADLRDLWLMYGDLLIEQDARPA